MSGAVRSRTRRPDSGGGWGFLLLCFWGSAKGPGTAWLSGFTRCHPGGDEVPVGRSVTARGVGACKPKGGASPTATPSAGGPAGACVRHTVPGCGRLCSAGVVPVSGPTGWARPRRISIVMFSARGQRPASVGRAPPTPAQDTPRTATTHEASVCAPITWTLRAQAAVSFPGAALRAVALRTREGA